VTAEEGPDEMNPDKASYKGLINAGAGTALAIVQLGAIIPGFLPAVVLTLVLAALVVVPLLALGLVLSVLFGPPAAVWWLWSRHRNRSRAPHIRRNPILEA
jgi:4-amino-4-deoxy-L-arabinose transferase-like glycosyltransferase